MSLTAMAFDAVRFQNWDHAVRKIHLEIPAAGRGFSPDPMRIKGYALWRVCVPRALNVS